MRHAYRFRGKAAAHGRDEVLTTKDHEVPMVIGLHQRLAVTGEADRRDTTCESGLELSMSKEMLHGILADGSLDRSWDKSTAKLGIRSGKEAVHADNNHPITNTSGWGAQCLRFSASGSVA